MNCNFDCNFYILWWWLKLNLIWLFIYNIEDELELPMNCQIDSSSAIKLDCKNDFNCNFDCSFYILEWWFRMNSNRHQRMLLRYIIAAAVGTLSPPRRRGYTRYELYGTTYMGH